MLLALQTAITSLLNSALPALFTGAGAVQVGFANDAWAFDASSADPVAGEPGPDDAVDRLAFDPAAPAGPHTLTRPPYPGPKRVYLRSAASELVALSAAELQWSPTDAASFTVQPRPGRVLTGFDQLEVHYGIVAAGTQLKALHKATLVLTAADAAALEPALALALAALALNRERLREQGAFSFSGGGYESIGTLKTLSFTGGSAAAGSGALQLAAEVDIKVQRLLGDDEGRPISHIVTPGRPGVRPVDISPAVQA